MRNGEIATDGQGRVDALLLPGLFQTVYGTAFGSSIAYGHSTEYAQQKADQAVYALRDLLRTQGYYGSEGG